MKKDTKINTKKGKEQGTTEDEKEDTKEKKVMLEEKKKKRGKWGCLTDEARNYYSKLRSQVKKSGEKLVVLMAIDCTYCQTDLFTEEGEKLAPVVLSDLLKMSKISALRAPSKVITFFLTPCIMNHFTPHHG